MTKISLLLTILATLSNGLLNNAQMFDKYDEMSSSDKLASCDKLSGTMYLGTCYTFEGQLNGITEVVHDGEDTRELIEMTSCPGGCAIWAITCAPETYQELCQHARNQGRDVMRKYVFYIFLGVFATGTLYVCCAKDDSSGARTRGYDEEDDDKYERASEKEQDLS